MNSLFPATACSTDSKPTTETVNTALGPALTLKIPSLLVRETVVVPFYLNSSTNNRQTVCFIGYLTSDGFLGENIETKKHEKQRKEVAPNKQINFVGIAIWVVS